MSHNQFEEELKIVVAARKGDAKAQRKIFEQFAPVMMSVCYRYAGDTETAKDLLQDGFIRLFDKLDMYAGTGSFAGWVRRVFVTTCLEYLRQKSALKLSESIDEPHHQLMTDEPSVIDKISADDLMEIISGLADGYRTVFNMYAIEGYSHAEIAEILGITEVTSRTQFMRARIILQDLIIKRFGNGIKRK